MKHTDIRVGSNVRVRSGKTEWKVLLLNSSSAVLANPKGRVESELLVDLHLA